MIFFKRDQDTDTEKTMQRQRDNHISGQASGEGSPASLPIRYLQTETTNLSLRGSLCASTPPLSHPRCSRHSLCPHQGDDVLLFPDRADTGSSALKPVRPSSSAPRCRLTRPFTHMKPKLLTSTPQWAWCPVSAVWASTTLHSASCLVPTW